MIYKVDIKKKPEGGEKDYIIFISQENEPFPDKPDNFSIAGIGVCLYFTLMEYCFAYLRSRINKDHPHRPEASLIRTIEMNFSQEKRVLKAVLEV